MSARRGTATRPEDLKSPRRRSTKPTNPPPQWRVDAEARRVRVLTIASALLAVCFVIITALVYAHLSEETWGDEIAWVAAAAFLGIIVMSSIALRRAGNWRAIWIDRLLLIGLIMLTVSMAVIGIDLH